MTVAASRTCTSCRPAAGASQPCKGASTSPQRPPAARAMVASVWFQGSPWPPRYHGTMPFGSWTEASHAAVTAISRCDKRSWPGRETGLGGAPVACCCSWPGRPRSEPGSWLACVHHDALAEHGVQQGLRPAGERLPAVMSQTRSRWYARTSRLVLAFETDRAAQPPVRAVQGVGMVLGAWSQPCPQSLWRSGNAAVDANVAPRHVVVGL